MSNPPAFPDPSQPGQPLPSPSFPPAQPPIGPPQGAFGSPQGAFGQVPPSPTPSWMPQPEPEHGTSKAAYAAVAAVALIAAGVVAFMVTRSDDKSVEPAQTTVVLPSITIPTITIPTITIPEITIPTIPGVTIPAVTVPAVTVPAETVPPVPPTTVPVAPTNLFTGTQAADVIAQIAAARGAAPLRILQALIYPEYAFAQVQDPSIPVNVDEYSWRGTLGTPAPVTLMGDGDLEANLFSDTEVNWAAIPVLVDTALAQIAIEGAEVTHISIQRNLPFTDTVQIRVFVNGTRGSGYLDADAQGNVIAVNTG